MSTPVHITVPLSLDLRQEDRSLIQDGPELGSLISGFLYDYIEYQQDCRLASSLSEDSRIGSLLAAIDSTIGSQ